MSRDEVFEKYVLVKGGTELLDRDTRRLFVGLREHPHGFEGLTDDPQRAQQWFGDQAIYEKPSLDDIMVYTIKYGGVER